VLHFSNTRQEEHALGEKIIVYGTPWCGDTRRSRTFLDRHGIAYNWVDIDRDGEGRRFVEQVNRGLRCVPTIAFPDGSVLIEPSDYELRTKLGL
jgi:glutaredoxin-like protein